MSDPKTKAFGRFFTKVLRLKIFLTAFLFLGAPYGALVVFSLSGLGSGTYLNDASTWKVLPEYLLNTLSTGFGSVLFALAFGLFLAWVLEYYDFPGKKLLKILAPLPLAIPPYLAAYALTGFFDLTGPLSTLLKAAGFKEGLHVVPGGPGAFAYVLGSQLYPYVYLTLVPALGGGLRQHFEAASLLGKRNLALLFSPGLGLLRPFLAASATLVLMESFNEYGAAAHFGVSTLTSGLFRAWFHAYDLNSALVLGLSLCAGVGLLLFLEQGLRQKMSFSSRSNRDTTPTEPKKLAGPKAALLLTACLIPVLAGLGLPLLQMFWWLFRFPQLRVGEVLLAGGNTVLSALGVGLAALTIAFLVLLFEGDRRNRSGKILGVLGRLGYGVPGVVGVLGILVLFGAGGASFLIGSLGFLAYALILRYFGVAYGGLSSAYKHRSSLYDDPARLLGARYGRRLREIHLPLLRPALFSSFLLLALDMSKELSTTLMARPLGFDTLATKLYEQASQELIPLCAFPGLVLVGITLIFALLLRARSKDPAKAASIEGGRP